MSNKISLKYIKSLQIKKYRHLEQSFCVEGIKSILEVIQSPFKLKGIAGTPAFFDEYGSYIQDNVDRLILDTRSLSKISSYKNNSSALAVVKMAENHQFEIGKEWIIALDSINDPGNLGTILRIADWYGIHKIVCSENTVELYNPKTIAASMGSFTRMQVYYTDLQEFISKQDLPVTGTFLKGDTIHDFSFDRAGILLMGSESHGIDPVLASEVDHRITIPSSGSAESLNVAIATAIVLDNLNRTLNRPTE